MFDNRKYQREWYHENKNRPEYIKKGLWKHAKHRAASKDLAFNISVDDIIVPSICPIMGKSMGAVGSGSYAPSLDRIIPDKGYIKGNIRVISLLANQMKWNSTPEELESFCVGMLRELGKGER